MKYNKSKKNKNKKGVLVIVSQEKAELLCAECLFELFIHAWLHPIL